MPGGDRTGPLGDGPMSGRGLGYCGRGLRQRRGFGARRGLGYYAGYSGNRLEELSKEEKRKILEQDLKDLEQERQDVEKRLSELGE